MPYYSDDIIEEVRSRNDIVDVISQYVRLSKKGSTYFGLCPFHNEKTGSFSVSPNKQMYYCFGCGAGGNVFTFLMEYENFTFGEAMEALADRAGVELPKQEYTSAQRQEADKRARLLEINKEAAKYFYMLLRGERGVRALSYFRKRELSDETMQKFGLGYSDQYSDDLYRYLRKKGYEDDILKESGLVSIDERRGGYDKFWNRAMFPIMDVHNKVIGFGGRVMGDGEPKYLNSPETKIFDKSRNLYGLNFARSTKKPQLLLCEGYMDVIALHQAGFDNAVASLGTALTSGHANLLKRYTKNVYLTYDSDAEKVSIPNREVAQEYVNAVSTMDWHEVARSIEASRKLLEALWKMDEAAVAKGVEQAHKEISVLQYNNENALSCTINLAFYFAREYYTIVRELPTGKGFADIVMIPRKLHIDKPAVVIELKWDKSVSGAIEQIKRNEYIDVLRDYKGNLLLAGINYSKKTKKHTCMIEQVQL